MIKHSPPSRRQNSMTRWLEILSYCGVTIGILLVAIVCYFELFAPDALSPLPPLALETADSAPDATEPDESAAPGKPAEADEAEDESGVFRGTVSPGDTAGVLLQEWLSADELHALIDACKEVYSLARIQAGQPYALYREGGSPVRFEYEIDDSRRLTAARENGRWAAAVEEIKYDIRLEKVEGRIDSSMFESMSAIGEQPALAVRLAGIFAWEINFIRDIQPGDGFRILLEKRYRDNEFKGYGRLLSAEFVNKGSKYEAFIHKDSFGNTAYYNAAGDSLRRAFLKAPLSFTRISSRFNLRRVHPIFNSVRPHPAMDYAAPSGTPVKAIGSGIVTFRGWGRGAGNYVSLKHANGYESMYLHLSGFARSLKKGGRVRQGDVIGYVGSTGYSTGPHLDFRMKKDGRFINPEKTLSPRDESVSGKLLAKFKENRDVFRRYIEGKKALDDYIP